MKNTKSIIALLLIAVMCASLMAGCGPKKAASGSDIDPAVSPAASASDVPEVAGDLAYIKDKGTLVVGITEFEPMDYQDASGNWIGFDADLATAFAKSLGVTVEFQIIEWDSKVMELDSKTIDVVWNGMTLTDEVKSAMECSAPYFNNAQVVIVPANVADKYQDVASLSELTFAVESGSAGKKEVEALALTFTEVVDQATALLEVSSGNAGAAVIDFLMAAAMTGEGTSYAKLTHTVSLNSEEYGVGFRKGSDLAQALNDFFKTAYADGTMKTIASTYGIEDMLIEQ